MVLSFIEVKMMTHNKQFTVEEIFLDFKKIWPLSTIETFKKTLSETICIDISKDNIISINYPMIDPWGNIVSNVSLLAKTNA